MIRVAAVSPLARKYALRLCGLTLATLLLSGGIQMCFNYGQSLTHIEQVQAAQANAAAREIETYLAGIEAGLRDAVRVPWTPPDLDTSMRREEFYRVMRLLPAIVRLQMFDGNGKEQLDVSRSAIVRVASLEVLDETHPLKGLAEQEIRYGKTSFSSAQLPSLQMAIRDSGGITVATLDLRLLGEVVARLSTTDGRLAYVVDSEGMLIAHARPTEVIGGVRMVTFSNGTSSAHPGSLRVAGWSTNNLRGEPVIVTSAPVERTRWLVFIEEPRSQALAPVWFTVAQTFALMAAGGAVALFLGIRFARRMAAPIVALKTATALIAKNQRNEAQSPIASPGGRDEIDELAQDFDLMSTRLRDLYASLEAKVTERTAQLSEARDVLAARAEELARLKEEADRANVAKTRFLAAASHDLRQPMHSISLLLGVLQARLDSAEHRALADKIQSSVATMESLFGNLLDISKLDAGAVQAHVENVDLGWLLRQVEQVWAPQAVEKGLRLRVRPCRLLVKGDAALLARIVGNLVANAIRYTRQGGVLVGCRRRGSSVELQVWDSGPGIEPHYREAIFEEFFRIDAPGTGQEKGLGLGLSIVQRCARLLGYGLRVDSRVGSGSVFTLTLPLAGETATRPGGTATFTRPPLLAGRFIVVVDDDETNAQALVDALQGQQCHVVAAASCDEVLAALDQHLREPDLIVTDYQLGAGRDGFEVIDRLRRHYDDDIAALIVTANTEATLGPRAQACGARLLHKPIGLQRLLEAMQESLPSADGA